MSATDDPLLDPERLRALRATGLLEDEPSEALERLTRLASRIIDAPVSLVSMVDEDRQVFAAEVGLEEPWASRGETPLAYSFCQHVVRNRDALVVGDATEDDRVRDNPSIEELGVRSYAGMPMTTADGHVLGSFCVIDDRPREWSEGELEILRDLASAAVTEIELRRTADALERALSKIRTLEGLIPLCAWCRKVRDDAGYWQELERYVREKAGVEITHGICPSCAEEMEGVEGA